MVPCVMIEEFVYIDWMGFLPRLEVLEHALEGLFVISYLVSSLTVGWMNEKRKEIILFSFFRKSWSSRILIFQVYVYLY